MTPELIYALTASAAAIALGPYAALAGLGLATQLGLVDPPAPLDGLAHPIAWLPLLLLAIVQGCLARFRSADLVSGAIHTLIAPLAAVLFCTAPLLAPAGTTWAMATLALVVAGLVQLYILAIHTAAWTAGPAHRLGGFTLLHSFAAGLLAVLSWSLPAYAFTWAVLLVLAPAPWLPRLLGAAFLPLRALFFLLSHPTRPSRWDSGLEALPRGLRDTARDHLTSSGGSLRNVRVAPASLARWGSHWPYIRGWLVHEAGQVPVFLHRRELRPNLLALESGPGHADHGLLIETLEVGGARPYALCVDGSGPPGPAILAAIERG